MPNTHIFKYLDYFVGLPHAPQYAVMITGPWGIGKSHSVRKYLDKLKNENKEAVYVSLYGIRSIDDIGLMIFLGTHQSLDNKVMKYGARVAKSVAKSFKWEIKIDLNDLLSKSKIDLLVFDDFERCQLTPVEVLGYLNSFVEHEEMKVLIVANESELSEQKNYKRMREKVVGRTFEMQPNAQEVLEIFVNQTSDAEAKQFLTENQEILLQIFQQSKTNNLRILKQTIWDWERFFLVIDNKMRNKQKGMVAAFKLFVALSFEVRSGRLEADDLTERLAKIVAGQLGRRADEEARENPLYLAQERYHQIILHDTILNDDVLIQVLCDGRQEIGLINQSLYEHEYFVQPEEEPAWRKVWHGITRDTDEFETAFAQMEEQFENLEFVDAGEVVHVFGLRLWCTEVGQLEKTIEEVTAECKQYVDQLVEQKRILAGSMSELHHGRMTGAYGLSIYRGDTDELRELFDYYVLKLEEAKQANWPIHFDEILELMANDIESLFARLCWTNDDRENEYAVIPIFQNASAERFVDCMLALHPEDQRLVFTTLEGRYSNGRLDCELDAEGEWVTSVRDTLLERAEDLPLIRRYAIRNDVDRVLNSVI